MPQQIEDGACERCGECVGSGVIDHCVECGRDLCPGCMDEGCCGDVPATSGITADGRDEVGPSPEDLDVGEPFAAGVRAELAVAAERGGPRE